MLSIRVPALVLLVLIMAFLATTALSQTFSVLYNFGSTPGNPLSPVQPGTIAQGRDGNFYTTSDSLSSVRTRGLPNAHALLTEGEFRCRTRFQNL